MRKISFVLMAFVALSLSACNSPSPEIKLQKQCDALTKENNEGRVYEAIMGTQVKEKTHSFVEEGRRGTWFGFEITFATKAGQEITVYSERFETYRQRMDDNEVYKKYKFFLDKVFHDNKDEPNYENYIFGICAYKNEEGKYMDQIDTLTLISKNNSSQP